uniref:Uncharacterized protein n=1 Tax=uncultured marine crenarchaeote HF4000_APKG9P22 TaxID=455609 RepID=B3TBL7_9ARCH|nr:hypothetical protein ALOHA_HF4000APKG9P22ctg2g27 [uncultured marine crenarchaeote HF4000_APKG9P22]
MRINCSSALVLSSDSSISNFLSMSGLSFNDFRSTSRISPIIEYLVTPLRIR